MNFTSQTDKYFNPTNRKYLALRKNRVYKLAFLVNINN